MYMRRTIVPKSVYGRQKRWSPLPPPPSNPDSSPPDPRLRPTLAWYHDEQCPYNQIVCEQALDYIIAHPTFTPVLPVAASLDGQPETNPQVVRELLRAGFWIHVPWLYDQYRIQEGLAGQTIDQPRMEQKRLKKNRDKRRCDVSCFRISILFLQHV